jgi:hypothetical protein
MGKIIRLTESDLTKIVKRVISEQNWWNQEENTKKKTFVQSTPRKVMDSKENELIFKIYQLLTSNGFKQNFNDVSDVYFLKKGEFSKYSNNIFAKDVSGPFKFTKGHMKIELNKRFADITIRGCIKTPACLEYELYKTTDQNTYNKIENKIKSGL